MVTFDKQYSSNSGENATTHENNYSGGQLAAINLSQQ